MQLQAVGPRGRLRTVLAACFAAGSLGVAITAETSPLRACRSSAFTTTFDGNLGFGDYRREVFLRRDDGSVSPVTSGGLSTEPTISGDARTLAYLRALPEMSGDSPASADELFVESLDGPRRTPRLLVRASFLHDPDLSPDGRYVAVAASMEPKPPTGPRPPLLRYPAGGVYTGDSLVRVTDQGPSNRIYVLDARTAAVVATVPAPAGALREEQANPVFSPDGTELAYESNVSTADDVRAPTAHSIRVARLEGTTAGRPVLSLSQGSLWSMTWSGGGTLSVTTAGPGSYRTQLIAPDGRLLREQPTPFGRDVIPLGRQGSSVLTPASDVPVSGAANFDVAACALASG